MYAAVAIYIISLVLASQKGILAMFVVLFPLIMGGLYSIKLPSVHKRIHGKEKYARLKDIPLVKNLTATTAWTVLMTFLPLVYLGGRMDSAFLCAFCLIYGRDLINTITFDIRDIEGDKAHNVITLPVILGLDKCRSILASANLAIFSLFTGAVFFGVMPSIAFFAVTLSTIYTDFYLSLIPKKPDKVFLYEVLIDGEFIAFGIFASLGRLIP